MADATKPTPSESTFRSFSTKQASEYTQARGSYPAFLYGYIVEKHTETGGQTGLVVDLGCGPGNVTRDVARYFDRAVGVDHGEGMIYAATELGGLAKSGALIEYFNATAEDFDRLPVFEGGNKVDLITVGTAAHWFDMPKFWAAAANLLRPGGSVAIWAYSGVWFHPDTPGAARAHEIMREMDDDLLEYMEPGNLLVRNKYVDLVLPWTPDAGVPAEMRGAFDEAAFIRKEWDADGIPSNGVDFMGGTREASFAEMKAVHKTSSPVVRWREAHPDLAGTNQDIINVRAERVRKAMGVKKEDVKTFRFKAGLSHLLLLVKRK